MLFSKSGQPPSTSSVSSPSSVPPPAPKSAQVSSSSIASSIGSASSLNLNSTGGSVMVPSNIKETLTKFINLEGINRSSFSEGSAKLTPKNSYAENKAYLATKFRSAQSEKTGKTEISRKDSVGSSRSDSDFVSTFPEMTLKPDVYNKQDTLYKQEVIQKPQIPVKQEMTAAQSRRVDGYVGFANMPNQIYRKSVKQGFEFTLMVVGESGLGKSTLINSMFLTDIYSSEYPGPSGRLKKTVNVESTKVVLKESGVSLRLTIVDTPGFGDAIDNSNCWNQVVDFVDAQHETYLDGEARVNRTPIADTRVHACLYFIAPSGHGLKPLDVEFMRKLQDKVNIIPIIAKADSLTPEEVSFFKNQIKDQITAANIQIYEFPDENFGIAEEKERKEYDKLKSLVPFAVVGSNTIFEYPHGPEMRRTRGRKYPWGVVDIEDEEHCDFVALRTILIRSNLLDLIEVTNNVLYENFRCRKLAGVAGMTMEKIPNKNPLATLDEEKREHQIKMSKMEREMEEVFERKVGEKKSKLEASQQELEAKLKEAADKLEAQKLELETKKKAFLEEKRVWEMMNGVAIEDLKNLHHSNAMDTLDVAGKKKTLANSISFRMGR